jgi:predicted Zn-dependent protease
MMQASRYSSSERIPEYLRTHPLTENRVADTRNRARQYPLKEPSVSLDYQLMRARVANQLATSPEEAINKFRGELAGTPRSAEAARYGLVLALTAAGKANEARLELDGIWSKNPERIEYVIADARIDMARHEPEKAVAKLAARLKLTPGSLPLTMTYADALMMDGKPHIAEEALVAQSKLNPGDPGLWYLLAEVQGLAGDIVGLHQSRAEYFILNGNLDQAEKQLGYALKLTRGDFLTSAKINQRMADIAQMRAQMDA